MSEMEFEQLSVKCKEAQARSISAFARSAVMDRIAGGPEIEAATNIGVLETRIESLETNLHQLMNLAGAIDSHQEDLREVASPLGDNYA